MRSVKSRREKMIGRKRYGRVATMSLTKRFWLGWKTRSQLLKVHGGDETLVNKLVERKMDAGLFREHPDLPGDADSIMYYCLVDLEKCEEDIHEDKTEIETGGEIHGPEAQSLRWLDCPLSRRRAGLARKS